MSWFIESDDLARYAGQSWTATTASGRSSNQQNKIWIFGEFQPSLQEFGQRESPSSLTSPITTYFDKDIMKNFCDELSKTWRETGTYLGIPLQHFTDPVGEIRELYITHKNRMGLIGWITDPTVVGQIWDKMKANKRSGNRKRLMGLSSTMTIEFARNPETRELESVKARWLKDVSLVDVPAHKDYGAYVKYASRNPDKFVKNLHNYMNRRIKYMSVYNMAKIILENRRVLEYEEAEKSKAAELERQKKQYEPVQRPLVYAAAGEDEDAKEAAIDADAQNLTEMFVSVASSIPMAYLTNADKRPKFSRPLRFYDLPESLVPPDCKKIKISEFNSSSGGAPGSKCIMMESKSHDQPSPKALKINSDLDEASRPSPLPAAIEKSEQETNLPTKTPSGSGSPAETPSLTWDLEFPPPNHDSNSEAPLTVATAANSSDPDTQFVTMSEAEVGGNADSMAVDPTAPLSDNNVAGGGGGADSDASAATGAQSDQPDAVGSAAQDAADGSNAPATDAAQAASPDQDQADSDAMDVDPKDAILAEKDAIIQKLQEQVAIQQAAEDQKLLNQAAELAKNNPAMVGQLDTFHKMFSGSAETAEMARLLITEAIKVSTPADSTNASTASSNSGAVKNAASSAKAPHAAAPVVPAAKKAGARVPSQPELEKSLQKQNAAKKPAAPPAKPVQSAQGKQASAMASGAPAARAGSGGVKRHGDSLNSDGAKRMKMASGSSADQKVPHLYGEAYGKRLHRPSIGSEEETESVAVASGARSMPPIRTPFKDTIYSKMGMLDMAEHTLPLNPDYVAIASAEGGSEADIGDGAPAFLAANPNHVQVLSSYMAHMQSSARKFKTQDELDKEEDDMINEARRRGIIYNAASGTSMDELRSTGYRTEVFQSAKQAPITGLPRHMTDNQAVYVANGYDVDSSSRDYNARDPVDEFFTKTRSQMLRVMQQLAQEGYLVSHGGL